VLRSGETLVATGAGTSADEAIAVATERARDAGQRDGQAAGER